MNLTPWRRPRPAVEAADAPADVTRKGFEAGVPLGGTTTASQARAAAVTRQQEMDELYQAYLACPWSSSCVDTIARLVTAGGLKVVPDDEHATDDLPKPPAVTELETLLRFTNPREDMIQLLRSSVTDLLIFGDCFIELRALLGRPAGLWTLDGTTVAVRADEHGEVAGYVQSLDGSRQAEFGTGEVIHVSLDAPRGGLYGVSPTRKLLLPITAWLFVNACLKEQFRKGDPAQIAVDLGVATSQADAQRWMERYEVYHLGPRAIGRPIVTRTGDGRSPAPVHELQPHKVPDYLAAATQLRDQIISGYGMTPAGVGVIESGNLGGGTGEAQARALHYNTVLPLQALLLEKVNFRLLRAFGITGWHLEFGEVDYRDSKVIEEIRDMRLRDGAFTLNRYRAEIGEPPVDGGDDPVLVDRQNLVLWADMADFSAGMVASKQPGVAPPPTPPAAQPAVDDPGGPKDTEPGDGPKESAHARDARALAESWQRAYRARRRQALNDLPPAP